MITRYCLLWLFLPLIGILNGSIREFVYKNAVGELPAHQISTLTGILLMGWFVSYISRRWPLTSATQAVQIGAVWFLFTVLFEFGFGHFLSGKPWSVLLHDYNLLEGRVWVFLLIWITIAPWVFYKMHSKRKHTPAGR
jgi:hypothetical protein